MKVKFVPQNVEVDIKSNETVLRVAQDQGLHIKSVCKGIPSCAECRVYIKEGEQNVLPPSSTELGLIGTAYFVDQRRLSCQLRCFGDVTIDLTEQTENEKEATTSKRPRGYVSKEAGESSAVMGNIMHDEGPSIADINEKTANENLQKEEMMRELQRIRSKGKK